jgi:hypothetical protein
MNTLIMQRGRLLATAMLTGTLLAACGSSSSGSPAPAAASGSSSSQTTTTGRAGGTAARTALRACLKAHGVTLPSRPTASRPPGAGGGTGGGLFGGGRSGGAGGAGGAGGRGFRANPKLAAAFQACGGAQFPRRRFAAPSHATIDAFVTCVRQHGYAMPSPNFSGNGPVFPATIRTNPKFLTASRSCISTLYPGGNRGPGAGPAGSTTTGGAPA